MSDQNDAPTVPHTTPHTSGTHIQMPDGSLVTIDPQRIEEFYAASREAGMQKRSLTVEEMLAYRVQPLAPEGPAAEEMAAGAVQTPVEAPVEEPAKPARSRATKEA